MYFCEVYPTYPSSNFCEFIYSKLIKMRETPATTFTQSTEGMGGLEVGEDVTEKVFPHQNRDHDQNYNHDQNRL